MPSTKKKSIPLAKGQRTLNQFFAVASSPKCSEKKKSSFANDDADDDDEQNHQLTSTTSTTMTSDATATISNVMMSNITMINWDGQSHAVGEPPMRSSLENCRKYFDDKLDIMKSISTATPEEKQILLYLWCYVKDQWQANDKRWWNPRDLKNDIAGIYSLSKTVQVDNEYPKFGSSFGCKTRVEQQTPINYAMLLLDENDLLALVPDELVDNIMALKLPGLIFHSDKTINIQLFSSFIILLAKI